MVTYLHDFFSVTKVSSYTVTLDNLLQVQDDDTSTCAHLRMDAGPISTFRFFWWQAAADVCSQPVQVDVTGS